MDDESCCNRDVLGTTAFGSDTHALGFLGLPRCGMEHSRRSPNCASTNRSSSNYSAPVASNSRTIGRCSASTDSPCATPFIASNDPTVLSYIHGVRSTRLAYPPRSEPTPRPSQCAQHAKPSSGSSWSKEYQLASRTIACGYRTRTAETWLRISAGTPTCTATSSTFAQPQDPPAVEQSMSPRLRRSVGPCRPTQRYSCTTNKMGHEAVTLASLGW